LWSHNNIKPINDEELLKVKDKNEMHQILVKRYKLKTAKL
jgi:hypothetical protein